MPHNDILKLLVKLLIFAAFARICVNSVPIWALAGIGFILLIHSGWLDQALVTMLYQSSSPLIETLIPLLIIGLCFSFLLKGINPRR